MKIEEGPAFGALIIGVGLAYLVYQKTENMTWAVGAGIAIAVVDYVFLIFVKKIFKK